MKPADEMIAADLAEAARIGGPEYEAGRHAVQREAFKARAAMILSVETLLIRRVGMSASDTAALRARLEGTVLLEFADRFAQLGACGHVEPVKERVRARELLKSEAAKMRFDDLVAEGYRKIEFRFKDRQAVILLASLVAAATEVFAPCPPK